MAYVCLGRSEELKDIYISGKFDAKGIHCSPKALAETKKLQKRFDKNKSKETKIRKKHLKISYLNVRSLRAHELDIRSDNYFMDSDLICCGETHLNKEEMIDFDGWCSYFVSNGKGKGIAAYSKLKLIESPRLKVSDNYSAINLKTETLHVIFLYLSKGFDEKDLFSLLDDWVEKRVPTAIMGDMNWNYYHSTKMKKYMLDKDFKQLIKKATFDEGTLIDHIYVNHTLAKKNITAETEAAWYTDHDIISLLIPLEQK